MLQALIDKTQEDWLGRGDWFRNFKGLLLRELVIGVCGKETILPKRFLLPFFLGRQQFQHFGGEGIIGLLEPKEGGIGQEGGLFKAFNWPLRNFPWIRL